MRIASERAGSLQGRGGEGVGRRDRLSFLGVSLLHAVSGTCPRHVAPERYERQEYPRARCSSVRRGCVASGRGRERERRGNAAPSNYFHPAAHRKSRHYERALATVYYGCTRCTAPVGDQGSSARCAIISLARDKSGAPISVNVALYRRDPI